MWTITYIEENYFDGKHAIKKIVSSFPAVPGWQAQSWGGEGQCSAHG